MIIQDWTTLWNSLFTNGVSFCPRMIHDLTSISSTETLISTFALQIDLSMVSCGLKYSTSVLCDSFLLHKVLISSVAPPLMYTGASSA